MEEKLKDYMENLFRDVPDTEQAREIKEEILQNILVLQCLYNFR